MIRLLLLVSALAMAAPCASAQAPDAQRVRPPAAGQFTPDPGRRPAVSPGGDIQAQRIIFPRVRVLTNTGYCQYGALGRLVCEAAEEWRCPGTTEILVRVGDGPLETMQCEVDCDNSGPFSAAGDCDCDFELSDCS